MRMLSVVVPLVLAFGTVNLFAAERDPKIPENPPTEQSASLSGTIHPPGQGTAKGAVAEIHVAQAGQKQEVSYALFADGGVSRQLKELANKQQSATITGVITKDGYRVTQVSGVGKGK